MAVVKIKVNKQAVRQLLRSNEVLAELERRATNIAVAAGPGMEVDSELGKTRARASVRTATPEAVRAEAKHRALTQAIDAARE